MAFVFHDPDVMVKNLLDEAARFQGYPDGLNAQKPLIVAAGLFSIAGALRDVAAALREEREAKS